MTFSATETTRFSLVGPDPRPGLTSECLLEKRPNFGNKQNKTRVNLFGHPPRGSGHGLVSSWHSRIISRSALFKTPGMLESKESLNSQKGLICLEDGTSSQVQRPPGPSPRIQQKPRETQTQCLEGQAFVS